ncbi:MAG: dTMP kinase [Oscillospiraceae bacterium]|jgi:dTMP kinase|nr:dTMP kinase [Oscillospiraceae bacterium]
MNNLSVKYDTVLFDLDGTITDSATGIAGSIRHVIQRMGLPEIEEEKLGLFMGPSLNESFSRHLGLAGDDIERAVAIYRDDYAVSGIYNNRVYQGIPNLLLRLKKSGASVILATHKPTVYARLILEYFGLLGLFDSVVGVPLDANYHDKADIVRQALPARRKGRAVMIGDRQNDMKAAKANNIDAIGVLYGYGSESELVGSGADRIAAAVSDLAEMLLPMDGGRSEIAPTVNGLFMTIEGIDGAGKTTQVPLLAERLTQMGWEVVTTREPGGDLVAEKIRELLKADGIGDMTAETEAYLFAASRAQHVRKVIMPALARGAVVISDRFVDSSIAYQGAGRELGASRVQRLNELAVDVCVPDLVMLLMVDLETALLRRGSATRLDRIERSGESFFRRVYDAFVGLAEEEPDRVHIVDASRSIEETTAQTLALAAECVKAHLMA